MVVLVSSLTLLYDLQTHDEKPGDVQIFALIALIVQAVCAFIVIVASLSFPRRPAIEYKGQQVDRQYTVSALNYWTLGWALDILRLARFRQNLEIVDLPMLHNKARSSYLLSLLENDVQNQALWKTLVWAHGLDLALQNAFACFSATVEFAPQLGMYALLRLLEQGISSREDTIKGGTLVVGLGLLVIFAAWSDTWLSWLGYSRIAVQVRSELSALVFAKATRRKDVKESKAKEGEDQLNERIEDLAQNGTVANPPNALPTKTANIEDDDVEKTRQSTINLVVRAALMSICNSFVTFLTISRASTQSECQIS